MDLCCICFDQVCTIEVKPCGHQMCAHCTLALCCLKKPDPSTGCTPGPVCPFCRGAILQLIVPTIKNSSDTEVESNPTKPRRSRKSVRVAAASRACQPLDHLEGLLVAIQERSMMLKSNERGLLNLSNCWWFLCFKDRRKL